jgi:hypothetical protein
MSHGTRIYADLRCGSQRCDGRKAHICSSATTMEEIVKERTQYEELVSGVSTVTVT